MRKNTRRNIIGGILLTGLIGFSLWIDSKWHPSISLGPLQRDLSIKLGLDLQGGSHLVYRAIIDKSIIQNADEALAGVRDVIERRVDVFGVAEPLIQTNRAGNEYRVIVELAGVHDPEEAIRIIGETPQLDFRTESRDANAQPINIDSPEQLVGPLFERTSLTGKHLKRAQVEFDQITGIPHVALEFDNEGSKLFEQITRDNIGRRVAIYLDQVPISAPVVQSEITNGKAVITGGFSLEEAKQLARKLNAGALPVPIELIGQLQIGPSLGKRSIDQSIRAGLVGLIAVVLWMTVYYRLPGFVSGISLVIYTAFFISIIKLVPITLSLAGIAGLIISIGLAVDANVLIFERLRENRRAGKTVQFALKDGFQEAWDSIRASNVSGLFSGLILYTFGTSVVRGFALTLSIGTLLSMFTAITITRGILTILLSWSFLHKDIFIGGVSKPSL